MYEYFLTHNVFINANIFVSSHRGEAVDSNRKHWMAWSENSPEVCTKVIQLYNEEIESRTRSNFPRMWFLRLKKCVKQKVGTAVVFVEILRMKLKFMGKSRLPFTLQKYRKLRFQRSRTWQHYLLLLIFHIDFCWLLSLTQLWKKRSAETINFSLGSHDLMHFWIIFSFPIPSFFNFLSLFFLLFNFKLGKSNDLLILYYYKNVMEYLSVEYKFSRARSW